MNTVNIFVKVKNKPEMINLILFQKIYSTNLGIVNHWATSSNSEYRLEIIIDENDLAINPLKITKSFGILTDEWNIADQMMSLHGKDYYQVAEQLK